MPKLTLESAAGLNRTHMCGELRAADAGRRAVLMGWVNRRRDLGNLIFIDLRDRSGMAQAVIDRQRDAALHAKASELRAEFVVAVAGEVRRREAPNPNMPTGEVELVAHELRLLNSSEVPPFTPADQALPSEETRLKFRYLDLRRPALQHNLELRHRVALAIRNHLSSRGFYEIETPFLTRSTPEGARDYLVPSRIYPGSFYALPQSPQLFKQLLMIAGYDRYFQIVRCFRDEDLRADRGPEFTQIDLEMSFPTQDAVFAVVEGFLAAAWKANGITIATPFPRMTYDEAMRLYGSDKPDLRLPPMTEVREAFTTEQLTALNAQPQTPLLAIRIPGVGELSRKERDGIKELFGEQPAARYLDFARIEKSMPQAAAEISRRLETARGDFIAVVAGAAPSEAAGSQLGQPGQGHEAHKAAGDFRLQLGRKFADRRHAFAGELHDPASYRFLWVTDFPMFEWDEDGKRWNAAHHPFTSPHEDDMQKVLALENLASVRSNAYDVVLNGMELGSGSIRIHRQDVQSAIFRAIGMTDAEARARFGFFLDALTYGTPPHGGMALGLDRIVMLLAGADSLREVIPFPKTAKAVDLMVEAPTPVSDAQLRELGLKPPGGTKP